LSEKKRLILCEGFRYRLDVETKSGDLAWRCSAKGCNARVRTDAGPTLVSLSRADTAGPGQRPGGQVHRKLWGFEELDIYLDDNFERTTPFLSDQKKLTLSLIQGLTRKKNRI
jgi:hypothetical protein